MVAAAAMAGDDAATAAMDAWIDRLSRALATVVNVLDPDAIVVGGGLSSIARIYTGVATRWTQIRVFRSRRHGHRAGKIRRRQRRPWRGAPLVILLSCPQ
jgi:predicted NBD/HSP70 family sugar kinase